MSAPAPAVDNVSTRPSGNSARTRRFASIPSAPGIRMSIRTPSGACRRYSSTARPPPSASPTTANTGAYPRTAGSPIRTT